MTQEALKANCETELDALVNKVTEQIQKSRTSDGVDLIIQDYDLYWQRARKRYEFALPEEAFVERMTLVAQALKMTLPKSNFNYESSRK